MHGNTISEYRVVLAELTRDGQPSGEILARHRFPVVTTKADALEEARQTWAELAFAYAGLVTPIAKDVARIQRGTSDCLLTIRALTLSESKLGRARRTHRKLVR